jgi:hypothetical protein
MSIAFSIDGCLCNFLCVEKSRNKNSCFVKRRIKKTTLEHVHPFYFHLPPFLFIPFFFSIAILNMSSSITHVILENQAMINM